MLEVFNIINFLILFIFILFFFIKNNLITYLILGEFIWILLYSNLLNFGLFYDILFLLNLNIFILILAGLDFSLGLLIYYFY